MQTAQRQQWINDALDMAFQALASWPDLRDKLVYKGGRVLALRLGGRQRASYDLDANLMEGFAMQYPDPYVRAEILCAQFEQAIGTYVEAQDPVRYGLEGVKVIPKPRREHPRGWNAFEVKVKLRDALNEGVLGLPSVEFDIAAPEELGPNAMDPLAVGGETVFAYTLQRMAGEKMRAFLSSLPSYRAKMQRPGDAVRVKDLHDISRILSLHPVDELDFWAAAAEEFRLACQSRYIDCNGIDTFAEQQHVTRSTYEGDETLPGDVSFDTAWQCIEQIVSFWQGLGIFPLVFPLPDEAPC